MTGSLGDLVKQMRQSQWDYTDESISALRAYIDQEVAVQLQSYIDAANARIDSLVAKNGLTPP